MKFSTLLLSLPIVLVAVVIAIANRGPVVFGLDPFSPDAPALSFVMPLFLLVFLVFFLGVVAGGATVALRRNRARRIRRAALHVGNSLASRDAKAAAADPAAQSS
jgi:hypothetical protein